MMKVAIRNLWSRKMEAGLGLFIKLVKRDIIENLISRRHILLLYDTLYIIVICILLLSVYYCYTLYMCLCTVVPRDVHLKKNTLYIIIMSRGLCKGCPKS